jgi:hypothetical protein
MRLGKRFVLDAVMVLCFGGLSVASPVQVHVPVAPVQAPHSIYVNVPVPGMLPAYLCDSPMKSSDCPEDTIGWAGSSEDDRVKA